VLRSRFQHTLVLMLVLTAIAASEVYAAQVPVGEFVLDESLSDDINKAINDATAEMNFIARPIARKRLRSTNPPTTVVTIETIGDSVEVTSDGRISLRAKPDGIPMKWAAFKNENLQVTTTFENGVLTNVFAAGDGSRTNRYVLRDNDLLEMRVTISSPRLEKPVEYTRVYRRMAAAQ
jgi:hypothetical protein